MSKELQKLSKSETIRTWLNDNRTAITDAIPQHISPGHLMRAMVQAISGSEKLQQCTNLSLIGSLIQSAMLGLEVNGPLGEAYLVPFRNKGVLECKFMPGYRGLITLARNSGRIAVVYAHPVYKGEEFDVQLGTDPKIVHTPSYGDLAVEPTHVYAVYTTVDGHSDFEVMTWAQIEKVRAVSKAKDSGPWITWPVEMGKKTVIKRLLKRAPLSVGMALTRAVDLDNRLSAGEQVDYTDVISEVVPDIQIPEDADVAPPPAKTEDPVEQERQRLIKHMHALGVEVHGVKGWDDARPLAVGAASNGQAKSSNDLANKEVQWIIDRLLAEKAVQEGAA